MKKSFLGELRRDNRRHGGITDPEQASFWGALFLVKVGKWRAVVPRTGLSDWHRIPASEELFDTPEEASQVARAAWAVRCHRPINVHLNFWGEACDCGRGGGVTA